MNAVLKYSKEDPIEDSRRLFHKDTFLIRAIIIMKVRVDGGVGPGDLMGWTVKIGGWTLLIEKSKEFSLKIWNKTKNILLI